MVAVKIFLAGTSATLGADVLAATLGKGALDDGGKGEATEGTVSRGETASDLANGTSQRCILSMCALPHPGSIHTCQPFEQRSPGLAFEQPCSRL